MLCKIAWRDLCRKPVQHFLTVLMAATAIALSIAVLLASASTQQGMTDSAMPFDMIVGAKGSATQLLFNTVFLQDTSIGNISHEVQERLEEDDRVARVIPFAFGDTVQGYRLVGSTTDIFDLRPSQDEPSIFQLEAGEFFQGEHEAVLGATAAKKLGLSVGDTFQSSHGLTHDGNEEDHEDSFTVCGILEPMNRPYDTGIFVPIEAMWDMHGNTSQDITALMVTPVDYSGLYQLYTELNNESAIQAVFPGVVMAEVFDTLGQTEDILKVITWISMATGLIGMAVSLSWSSLSRIRENAIMRAVGAGRGAVLAVVLIEAGILSLASAGMGLAAGHVIAWAIARYMQSTQAFYSPVPMLRQEWVVLGISVAAGILLSLIPAWKACRQDVIKGLTEG